MKDFFSVFNFLFVVLLSLTPSLALANDPIKLATDYDGDNRGDLVLFNPATGAFLIRKSSDATFHEVSAGSAGNTNAAGDFNGDGKADFASYNRSTNTWTTRITNGSLQTKSIGSATDLPTPADFDGDGCTDHATFNRQTGVWTIGNCNNSSTITRTFGARGSFPVPADYDCDGNADLATFERDRAKWSIRKSTTDTTDTFFFGLWGDYPLAGDYDGDGCVEASVYRPFTGQYFPVSTYSNGQIAQSSAPFQWGLIGDRPSLTNIGTDLKSDFTIYRPWEAAFYVMANGNSFSRVAFPLSTQVTLVPATNQRFSIARNRGDYNRDGLSDFATARVNRDDNKTTFSFFHLNGGTSTVVVNAAADAIVPGDFDGDGRIDPTVVTVRPDTFLEWRVSPLSSGETTEIYGINRDQPITGDFDCDGKDDKAVVRTANGYLNWYIKRSAGSEILSHVFGLQGDIPFTADVTGDGCDELVVARTLFGGIHWYYQTLALGGGSYVQWGLQGDKILPPADVNGDGKGDFIIFRNVLGQNQAFVRFSANGHAVITLGRPDDTPLTGYFSGVNGAELGTYRPGSSSSTFIIKRFNGQEQSFSFGNSSQFLLRPDGTVVGPGSSGGGGLVSCDTTKTFVDGTGTGALWKPVSESTGNVVFLLPSSYWTSVQKIQVYAEDTGQFIVNGNKRSCCPNGNRAHFDIPKKASFLAQYKPILVKLSLSNGKSECRRVPDPTKRYD